MNFQSYNYCIISQNLLYQKYYHPKVRYRNVNYIWDYWI